MYSRTQMHTHTPKKGEKRKEIRTQYSTHFCPQPTLSLLSHLTSLWASFSSCLHKHNLPFFSSLHLNSSLFLHIFAHPLTFPTLNLNSYFFPTVCLLELTLWPITQTSPHHPDPWHGFLDYPSSQVTPAYRSSESGSTSSVMLARLLHNDSALESNHATIKSFLFKWMQSGRLCRPVRICMSV